MEENACIYIYKKLLRKSVERQRAFNWKVIRWLGSEAETHYTHPPTHLATSLSLFFSYQTTIQKPILLVISLYSYIFLLHPYPTFSLSLSLSLSQYTKSILIIVLSLSLSLLLQASIHVKLARIGQNKERKWKIQWW